jgi:hypothetical protein
MAGTAYDRDLQGRILHICPECTKGLRVSILHPTGAATLLRGMEGVSADWCKMYEKPGTAPTFTITNMVENPTGTFNATAEGKKQC